MGISTVNMALGNSYGAYNQKLTQATKQELESLGLQYNPNITEAEGKKLIQTFKMQNNKNSNNETLGQGMQNSQSDLFEKAKKLAEKLGIQVPQDAQFQQLLNVIQMKLEQRLAISTNDINAIKELKSLSHELAFIQAQSNGSSGYDNTNQALMKSLEILSEYNKNFLNK